MFLVRLVTNHARNSSLLAHFENAHNIFRPSSPMLRLTRLLAVVLSWFAFQVASEAKSLQSDNPEQVVETKPGQEKVEATFTFKNTGSQQVKIGNVSTSCGCTDYRLGKDTLAPGDETTLVLVVNVGGRSGSMTITASVYVEDQREPEVVRLNLRFPERFSVRPRLLTWKTGEKPVAKRALIQKGPAAPAKTSVLGVQTKDEGFETRLVPAEKEGDFWVEVTPKDTRLARGAVYQVVLDPAVSSQEVLTIYAYIK